MADINTKGSVTATIENKLLQPRLLIQALVFTGILYLSAGQTPPSNQGVTQQSAQTGISLSVSVSNSVLQHASKQSGLPISALHIIQAQPKTWSDSCLGLADARVLCTQMPVPGWQVAVASSQHHWIYRTDASGSRVKLERGISLPSTENENVAFAK